MTPEELVDYYVNLLIIQYKTLPNASATIALLSSQVVADMIYTQVLNGFALESAIGKQLDTLGEYVGVQRILADFTPAVTYMAFPAYSDGPSGFGGMASYSDIVETSVFWKSYTSEDTAFVMTDGQLRALIQYLVALRITDFSNGSIDDVMFAFFGDYVEVTDNEDMTVTYTHDSSDPNLLFSIVDFLGLLPRPAGVKVNVVEV